MGFGKTGIMNTSQTLDSLDSLESAPFIRKLRNGIWTFGIPSWLFGITDRSIAALADGYLSAIELTHLFMASFFFLGWLYLKPEPDEHTSGLTALQSYQSDLDLYQPDVRFAATQARMLELKKYHLVRQEYVLPFHYLCQVYHLLNLKHLETIHSFSLNNLRVLGVSEFQTTEIGGRVKFQTVLESPFNPLRIWRQPIVEVDLVLHSPFTVELSVPVYNDKRIIVLFNVLPINNYEHKLFIDIYSNLTWPRPILQLLLHIAACLTLFEDLPYLRKLAERNISRLVNLSQISSHETMWLFRRFVDLYGSSVAPISPSQPTRAIASEGELLRIAAAEG